MYNKEDDYCLDQSAVELRSYNFTSLKSDNELFDEEEFVEHPVISIKYKSQRQGESWEILENNKLVLLLKSPPFTKAEKNFFKTPEGMRFIMNSYKEGLTSANKIKQQIKKIKK